MTMDSLPAFTLTLCFAALFGGAAAHQLLAWAEWPAIVRNYRLLPGPLAAAAAAALPAGEALVAGALLWPGTRAMGAAGAALLLLVFAAAIEINVRRGRTSIDCGCVGAGAGGARLRTGLSRWMVVRNVLLAAFVLALLLPESPRALSPFEVGAALASVATLAFLYPVLGVALRRPPAAVGIGQPLARRPRGAA